MKLQIATTQDTTLEDLTKDPSFRGNVESAIASSLGVQDKQVLMTKIEIASRRLGEAADSKARRLNDAPLKVDYEVYMSGDAERNRIKGSIEKGEIATAFKKELRTKEKASGRSVVVDDMQIESVDVVDRMVPIEEAKLAAIEKAATTSPPSTSPTTTTVKKTIASATDPPASPEPDDVSAVQDPAVQDPAVGGAASYVPSATLLVALLFKVA